MTTENNLDSPRKTYRYLLNMSFESSGNFSMGTSLSLALPSLMRESQNAALAMMAELRPGFDPDDVSFARFGLVRPSLDGCDRGDVSVRFTLEAVGVLSLGVHFALDVTNVFSFSTGVHFASDGTGASSFMGGAVTGVAGGAAVPSSSWKISSRRLRGRLASGVVLGVVWSCFNFSRIVFGRSRPVRLYTYRQTTGVIAILSI